MHSQEDLQLTVRNGQHQLVGLVSLGGLYENMKLIKTGSVHDNLYIIVCFIAFPTLHCFQFLNA
jgi:hypothetical protein